MITPIKQAFEELFVVVRNAVAEVLPTVDTAKLSMWVHYLEATFGQV